MGADYFAACEASSLRRKYDKSLSVIHVSAQSARNKEEYILALLATLCFEPDVFMVAGTW